MSDRLQLPPTPPAADAPLSLHDAELVRLTIDDRGRRMRLLFVADVDLGPYDQPVEVVIEGADYVFFHDESEGEDALTVFRGGPVGHRYRYGRIEAPEHGVDYTLAHCGAMGLVAVRARAVTTVALPSLPPPDPMLTEPGGWTPLDAGFIRRHMPDPRRSAGYQVLDTLVLDLEVGIVTLRLDVEQQEHPSWMARAKYAGAARIDVRKDGGQRQTQRRPGEVLGFRFAPHGAWDRLQFSVPAMYANVCATEWECRER